MDSLPESAKDVYDYCLERSHALVSQGEIQDVIANSGKMPLDQVLNLLLRQRLVETLQHESEIFFRAISLEEAKKIQALQDDEQIVYSHIRAAGNEGIWTRTLKTKANLHQAVVSRCLKSLETHQLVKSVKSVKYPTRKIYMLYNVYPSAGVTGGVWFTDQELDTEFINSLLKGVYRFIRSKSFPRPGTCAAFEPGFKGYPSAQEIFDWLKKSGLAQVELQLSHIMTLLNILIDDGKIEKRNDSYKAIPQVHAQIDDIRDITAQIPCIDCPVSNICGPQGPIQPSSCVYLKRMTDSLNNDDRISHRRQSIHYE